MSDTRAGARGYAARVLHQDYARGLVVEGLPDVSHARARTEAGGSHTPDVFTCTVPYAKAFYLFLPPRLCLAFFLFLFFF